jgi:hypothetical protein
MPETSIISPRLKEVNDLLASQQLVSRNKLLYEKLRGEENQ